MSEYISLYYLMKVNKIFDSTSSVRAAQKHRLMDPVCFWVKNSELKRGNMEIASISKKRIGLMLLTIKKGLSKMKMRQPFNSITTA